MTRQLHFNLFLHDTGHHEASWRLPESDPHANLSLTAHQHLARVAPALVKGRQQGLDAHRPLV